MFAVIKTGGKQYRVAPEDVLKIEKIAGEVGDIVQLGEVLAHGEGENVVIGAPFVGGASVAVEVLAQGKARTVIAFKKRRRQNSRRKIGHRHLLTTVRISEILLDGAKPANKAAAKATKAEVTSEATEAEAKPAKKEAAPKKEKAEAAPKKEKAEAAAKEGPAPEAAASAAQPLFKAPKSKADDLAAIKGIGPVAASQLNEQGITTFAQLAKLTAADIEKIDANMPFSADQVREWQEQAKELTKK